MTNSQPSLCPGQEETVFRFMDDDLAPVEREAFLTHLASCNSCQTLLVEAQALFDQFDTFPEQEPPVDMVSRVMTHLPNSDPAPATSRFDGLILAGQLLIGLLLMLFSWPFIASMLAPVTAQQWGQTVIEMIGSLQQWAFEIALGGSQWLQATWPPPAASSLTISPMVGLALVAALAIAWLIGNGLLLRGSTPLSKNGGSL